MTGVKSHYKAFTLAEVLITLVIIGVIAALTVPSIIANAQEKEFAVRLKKNYSVLDNAIRKSKLDYGNRIFFSKSYTSVEAVEKFKNYLNVMKYCKKSTASGCSDVYHNVYYATNYGSGYTNYKSYPSLVLQDGTILYFNVLTNCETYYTDCYQDSDGNCKYDSEGNKMTKEQYRGYCAYIYVDLNGDKKPNKFGKDVFCFLIYRDYINVSTWGPFGGTVGKNILINAG